MIAAIIAAAGVGKRMGHHIPKPYLQLAGKPILAHTLKIFEAMPEIREVTVVVHPEDLDLCQDTVIAPYNLKKVLRLVPGGKERQDSVYHALKALKNEDELEIILVHDGVRPFVTPEQIRQVIDAARQARGRGPGAAGPGHPEKSDPRRHGASDPGAPGHLADSDPPGLPGAPVVARLHRGLQPQFLRHR